MKYILLFLALLVLSTESRAELATVVSGCVNPTIVICPATSSVDKNDGRVVDACRLSRSITMTPQEYFISKVIKDGKKYNVETYYDSYNYDLIMTGCPVK